MSIDLSLQAILDQIAAKTEDSDHTVPITHTELTVLATLAHLGVGATVVRQVFLTHAAETEEDADKCADVLDRFFTSIDHTVSLFEHLARERGDSPRTLVQTLQTVSMLGMAMLTNQFKEFCLPVLMSPDRPHPEP